MILTDENLKEFGTYMQRLLALNHWNVTYEIVSSIEMRGYSDDETALGYNIRYRECMCASIYINEEGVYNFGDSWETTVVHELMHILFDEYDLWVETTVGEEGLTEHGDVLRERTIDWISRSLYKAWKNDDFLTYDSESDSYKYSGFTQINTWS